jgi:hypothetical protein
MRPGQSQISLRAARTYPLEQIADAHQALVAGGLRGRIVMVPDHEQEKPCHDEAIRRAHVCHHRGATGLGLGAAEC